MNAASRFARHVAGDLRHGARRLVQAPLHTGAVLLVLALGIGVSAAIFAVVHAVLLAPLPFPEAGRLVVVWESQLERGLEKMFAAPRNALDWLEARSLEDLALVDRREAYLGLAGGTIPVQAAEVSASLLTVLGVEPLVGRGFTAEEDRPGGAPAVMLGHAIWRSRFGGDRRVVGRSIPVDGRSRTVVGVLPAGFDFPPDLELEGTASAARTQIWLPLELELADTQRGARYLVAIGRLAAGASITDASGELGAIAARLAADHPESNDGWGVTVTPLAEQIAGPVRPALMALSGAGACLLMIVCLNVAGLLLARSLTRRRERAIRTALGAGSARLLLQSTVESLLLATAGGLLGLALARWTLSTLLALAPRNLPRQGEIALDGTVLSFTVGVTLLVGVVCGLLGGARTASPRWAQWLRERGAGSTAAASSRLRGALVVAEIALSVTLLAGAGLLLRSFLALQGVDPGFETSRLLTFNLVLPGVGAEHRDRWARTFDALERRVGEVPGVEAAGLALELPLADDRQGTTLLLTGESEGTAPIRRAGFTFVTDGYFRAMGIPLLAGRVFGGADRPETPRTLVVDRALARQNFGEESPIGHRITLGFSGPEAEWEIVGVVGEVRHDRLGVDASPSVYGAFRQLPWDASGALVVRTAGEPSALVPAVAAAVREVDPAIGLGEPRPGSRILSEATARERFTAWLTGLLAATALALAAIGLYGLVSFSVGQRQREMAIRAALGGRPRQIWAMVLGQGAVLTGAGCALGLVGAVAVGHAGRALLFGVAPGDPLTLTAVVASLAVSTLAACFLPARRAAAIDPAEALRDE